MNYSSEDVGDLLREDVDYVSRAFPDFSPSDTLVIARTGAFVRVPDRSQVYVIEVSRGSDPGSLVAQLSRLHNVIYAEVESAGGRYAAEPSDPYYSRQWALNGPAGIRAAEAWEITTGGYSTLIGIVDSGIDGIHEDLIAKVTGDTGWEIDHGSSVAGIVGARTNTVPNKGVAGINWQATLYSSRNDESGYVGTTTKSAQAIYNALSAGCDVINASWSYGHYSAALREAIFTAYLQNVPVIAATDNLQQSNPFETRYPAAWTGVVAVGAINEFGIVTNYSGQADYVDLVAPGEYIWTVWAHPVYADLYRQGVGTSFAAPQVTGVASLLLAAEPALSTADVEGILKASALDPNGPGPDPAYGYGWLRADRALQRLSSPYVMEQPFPATGGIVVSATDPYNTWILYHEPYLASGYYLVKRYEVQKSISFSTDFFDVPAVWGRWLETKGWGYEGGDAQLAFGWCEAVEGSITTTGATLRTYVYRVFDIWTGNEIGWYPTPPSYVQFAWTASGRTEVSTGVRDDIAPVSFSVLPNPSAGRTAIRFTLPKELTVGLQIFDSMGRLVRDYDPKMFPPGPSAIEWDGLAETGGAVASGVYFFRLNTLLGNKFGKITFIR